MYINDCKPTPPRSKISIEHRWGVIQASVSKFCGFYDKVVRINRSGTTLQDKLDEACSLYEGATSQTITLLHCWKVVNTHPKWTATLSSLRRNKTAGSKHNSSQSPGSFSAINLEDSSPSTECDVGARPCGHKAAKKRSREVKPPGYDDVLTELSTGRKET